MSFSYNSGVDAPPTVTLNWGEKIECSKKVHKKQASDWFAQKILREMIINIILLLIIQHQRYKLSALLYTSYVLQIISQTKHASAVLAILAVWSHALVGYVVSKYFLATCRSLLYFLLYSRSTVVGQTPLAHARWGFVIMQQHYVNKVQWKTKKKFRIPFRRTAVTQLKNGTFLLKNNNNNNNRFVRPCYRFNLVHRMSRSKKYKNYLSNKTFRFFVYRFLRRSVSS